MKGMRSATRFRAAEEDHVVFGGDEVGGSEVGEDLAFETASVVEVELFQ
jgi:hypothetical protein